MDREPLLIATTNPGKAAEVSAMLPARFACLLSLEDFPGIGRYEETGQTFQENAEGKALHYSGLTGLMCLADDSGLEVAALDGRPGVFSARYGEEDAGDAARNEQLVRELEPVAPGGRGARFVCHLALAFEGTVLASVRGELEGAIASAPRGANGFGYDPLFIPQGCVKTLAELTSEAKNKISHRSRALRKLRDHLESQTR